jgi:predicted dehydrogenase/threonine dehydrogenase-like Zn-dependent dehydrogenase
MKQIAQNYKSGKVTLEQVDPPAVKAGTVLVRSHYSVISPGTEGTKIKEAKMNLAQKAKARPDHVKKVLTSVRQQGLLSTYRKVMNKLDSLTPLGYSASGTVEAVGRGVEGFTVGQRVAVAGAGYANHAEFNVIPTSLITPIPDEVAMDEAAFATIATVSMHGFRQGEVSLGETAVVMGLGLVGQLLIQLLSASGIRAIGIDLDQTRCQQAVEISGAIYAGTPDDSNVHEALMRGSDGYGADCVFLTVGSDSNTPLESALELVRDRGRVVCVGKTKMDLPYNECFAKEIDFRFSRSYGPGRYDANYEEKGQDYPIGYVRWTEGRNLSAFIDLLEQGKLNIAPLITHRFPFDEAVQVYEDIHQGHLNGMGLLFEYPEDASTERSTPTLSQTYKAKETIGIGCIGAGAYASSMLLPHLKNHRKTRMEAVANATALSAKNAGQKFSFNHSGTDYQAWINEEALDALIIGTRHASHPHFVCEGLRANKAVFVEKPLAIDLEGLQKVQEAVKESGNTRLHVGFNRRFSPILQQVKKSLVSDAPLAMHYRVHAGKLPRDNWTQDKEEGGRFIGEAGHFLDVFAYLTDAKPLQVSAVKLSPKDALAEDEDNLAVTIHYDDGSIATLHYLTHGGDQLPKERLEISGGHQSFIMDNFETLTHYRQSKGPKITKGFGNNKGQKQQIDAFVEALLKGEAMPIALDSLYETSLLTIAAVEAVKEKRVIDLAEMGNG